MIDVDFDFTSELPGYWDGYWERDGGIGGCGKYDPDGQSPTLQQFQQELWSRELPDGEFMQLKRVGRKGCLTWNDRWFSSDSIIVSFRYPGNREMVERVYASLPDHRTYFEDFIRKTYTIAGEIIFPVHRYSMNQARGCHPKIRDRWDLTMECIRRFYAGEDSPLSRVLNSDKEFYDLFVDFQGYVDFFFLNDCVSDDYKSVDIWTDGVPFEEKPIPQTVEGYFSYIDKEMDFLEKRKNRIRKFLLENK